VLPNVTMRANRHLTLVQNKETVIVVDDVVTDDGTTVDVLLELLTGDGQVPFKGALIRVEQVYTASSTQNVANTNLLTTATATTSMEHSFELRPQSSNAQASNFCWNHPQLVQAVTHKSPAPKQSMSAVLSVTTDLAALPVIFAIDVTVVIANNATMSIYGLQSFRLRLDRQSPQSPLSTDASSDSVVVVDPDNVADDDHRVYPDLNATDIACQLCSNSREKLRYPDATVRWNGTDVACAALSSIASQPHQCRIAQELIQDDDDAACGGCRPNTDCALPCDKVDPRGTVPILGRTIDCHLLTESLDVLLTVRTCAVSQALVRAHCGCQTTDDNDGLETISSSTSSSVRQQNDNSKPTWMLRLFLPISLLLSLL
jgi:hypothetical protein